MSFEATSRVWNHAAYHGGTLLVLLALADWADSVGYCFPKIPTIARKARLTKRQVQNILRDLQKDGVLDVVRGGGRGVGSHYRINLGELEKVKSISLKLISVKSEAERVKLATLANQS